MRSLEVNHALTFSGSPDLQTNRGASDRARIAATDHHGRLLGRSAAVAASLARTASNALRHALLRPHGEPPAAAGLRPMAASSTPQPRRERPRADRRHRPPRPPPGCRGRGSRYMYMAMYRSRPCSLLGSCKIEFDRRSGSLQPINRYIQVRSGQVFTPVTSGPSKETSAPKHTDHWAPQLRIHT
jgi:hypothetical protein